MKTNVKALDSNKLDMEGHMKAASKNELVVLEQNITETYTSDLGLFLTLFVAFSG